MSQNGVNPGGSRTLGERIAGRYAAFMTRSLAVMLAVFTLVFWTAALIRANGALNRALDRAPKEEGTVALLLTEDGAHSVAGEPPLPGFLPRRVEGRLCLVRGTPGRVAAYDLEGYAVVYVALFVALTVFEIIRTAVMRARADILSRKALSPITDIAEAARRLSAGNLSSRIPAGEAKGELRDLTDVLNGMLDRIETSYNNQLRFVSDASHELRTPIAVIQGYADMLSRWGKSDETVREEAISSIRSESRAMKVLVEQLLFIARHDGNPERYKMEYFDLQDIAREAVRETRLIAGAHTVEEGGIESAIVLGDRDALKQALRVFLDNALKYTAPDGRIVVSLKRDGSYARLTVEDDGVGIAQEDLTRIFDRFYRTPDARGSSVDGHGLGLSIARIIVKAHGGRIEAQSKPGKGSRFHMLLRL